MPEAPFDKSLRIAVAAAFLLPAACVPPPRSTTAQVAIAPETVAADRSFSAAPAGTWPATRWWRANADPALSALIEEGLRQSPDVAAAAARFRRAGAMATQAGAALLPQLDAQAGVTLDKQSYNNGFPKEFLPKGWRDSGEVSAMLGFDPDVWGRNRATLAAATSQARAAALDLEQARLSLSTGIALAWYDLARLFEERDVARAALALRSSSRDLVSGRMANGLDTRGSLRQAEAQVATAQARLAQVDQAIALRRNQLAALLGAGPDRGLDIARAQPATRIAAGLPADATTALVGRRPDIAAARARLEAAASRIKAARASFFPAVRLDALIGFRALGIGNLLESDSTFGSVGPAISLPIFRGGALKGRYREAEAAFDEAVAGYDATVLQAYREVADAVAARDAVMLRLAQVQAARSASEDAYHIARLRYEGGLSRYLDVLAVEDRLLDARLAAAAVEAEARALDVQLVRALGGGFESAAAEPNGER